jgi:hypothetical protein
MNLPFQIASRSMDPFIAAQSRKRELRFRSRARAHARLHIEKDKRDMIPGNAHSI